MPNFTYLPDPEDPETVSTHGFSFTAGEWTPVPEDHVAVAKLRANRFFAEEGSASGQIEPEQSDAASGTELHDSGGADIPDPADALNKQLQNIPPPDAARSQAIEITPLQCRAARAGLEWSREHLAELANVGERTITDFERHASNMLRSKRTAIRKAF
jgi:DNA-binding XRE family transcriptional regulator